MERGFVSKSAILSDLLKIVEVAANTSSAVLLDGGDSREKEFFARMLHFDGARRENPFVRVNCASGENAREEILVKIRDAFSFALGGTVFFDEVAELPLEAQSLLLRFVQNKGEETARIVAATRFNLEELVDCGRFSGELLSALSAVILRVPVLDFRFDEEVSDENSERDEFRSIFTSEGHVRLKDAENIFKKNYLRSVLETTHHNQTKAAQILEIQRTYLSRLVGELGIRN
ncbi:MAG: sigma 54-interacting transcriptional regulator [Treponemataceae bacterium]|nr:sigma 54-interacting transcriptional regulator [Treponemataceae bacterium]